MPGRPVALAELLPIGTEDRGQVRECGRLPAECLVQQHVAGRAGDPLVAAQYVRDLHQHGRRPGGRGGTWGSHPTSGSRSRRARDSPTLSSPWMMSWKVVEPSRGTAKRTTDDAPRASRAARSSAMCPRHEPVVAGRLLPRLLSSRGARPAAPASNSSDRRARGTSCSTCSCRSASRSDCTYGPKGPPRLGPSSQSRPNHSRRPGAHPLRRPQPLAIGVLDANDELAAGLRAKSQLNRKVRKVPICGRPVGLGAMRTRTGRTSL